jgi:hypothetical protein
MPYMPGQFPGELWAKLTPEERARMTQEQGENAETQIKSFGASAADPFGIPSWITGKFSPETADAWHETQSAGSPLMQIGGAALAPAGAITAPLSFAPKMATLGLGALEYFGSPTQLNAKEKRPRQQQKPATDAELQIETGSVGDPLYEKVKSDPALSAKYTQMKQADAQSRAPVQGVNAESSDRVRAQAGAQRDALMKEITDELTRRNPPKLSFEQAHPDLARNQQALQFAASTGMGALFGGVGKVIGARGTAPWRASLDKFAKFRDEGGAALENAADDVGAFATKFDSIPPPTALQKTGAFGGKVAAEAGTAGAGGLLSAELASQKDRYNELWAEPGSPEYEASMKAKADPVSAYAFPFLLGAGGALTGKHGASAGGSLFRSTTPPTKLRDQSEAALTYLAKRKATQEAGEAAKALPPPDASPVAPKAKQGLQRASDIGVAANKAGKERVWEDWIKRGEEVQSPEAFKRIVNQTGKGRADLTDRQLVERQKRMREFIDERAGMSAPEIARDLKKFMKSSSFKLGLSGALAAKAGMTAIDDEEN